MKHLIKLAMIMTASVATYYVFAFTAHVAPLAVAIASAGALVATYVGLAFAPIPAGQRQNATAVALIAMGIEALYGVLYVLGVQSPELFVEPLPFWLSLSLAVLHGAPFTVLLYFVSRFVVHGSGDLTPQERLYEAMQQAQQDWLKGTVQQALTGPPPLLLPRQASYPPPVRSHEAETTDLASEHIADESPVAADRTCKYCGTSNLTMSQVMEHGRTHKRYGTCG